MDDVLERAYAAEDEGRTADALVLFEAAAAQGSPEAMLQLGLRIEDDARADELIQRAADLGDPAAMWVRGSELAEAGDTDAARAWLVRAAAAGNGNAACDLGDLAWDAGDAPGAEEHWRRAEEAGSVDALTALGFLAKQAGDLDAARSMWEEAAGYGNSRAMYHLAHLDLAGHDRAAAEEWFAQAAQAGDPDAMLEYGGLAMAAGALDVAAEWWEGATMAGNNGARENLLMLCTYGRVDAVAALRRLPGGTELLDETVAAAEGGAVPATVAAAMVARSDGDEPLASALLERAAAAGNDAARYLLGEGPLALPTGYFRRAAEHLIRS